MPRSAACAPVIGPVMAGRWRSSVASWNSWLRARRIDADACLLVPGGALMIAPPKPARGVVVALGGNALLPSGERGDIHQQFAHTRSSLEPIVKLAREGWRIAIVHGNGPQIGDELYRNEMARAQLPPLPLGVLVAGTAGWIGYMIQQSLQNALEKQGIERAVVTLITQVLVDRDDPATREPSKP